MNVKMFFFNFPSISVGISKWLFNCQMLCIKYLHQVIKQVTSNFCLRQPCSKHSLSPTTYKHLILFCIQFCQLLCLITYIWGVFCYTYSIYLFGSNKLWNNGEKYNLTAENIKKNFYFQWNTNRCIISFKFLKINLIE